MRTYLVFGADMKPITRGYEKANRKSDAHQSKVTGRIPYRAALKAIFLLINPPTASYHAENQERIDADGHRQVERREVTAPVEFVLVETGDRKDGSHVDTKRHQYSGRVEKVPESERTPFMMAHGLKYQAVDVMKIKA